MDRLESCFEANELEEIKKWCLFRQKSGFQGRPNKPVDTCYSFWLGASLEVRMQILYASLSQKLNILLDLLILDS